jgi:hypothetical protein
MARKPLAINVREKFGSDEISKYIAMQWINYHTEMNEKIEEWKETRNYIFATDTTTTSNQSLPWKNKTTIPKLCQIRDNLHSNYISALFPNDDWLRWEAYTQDDATKKKREAIESYMSNKCREGHFRTEMSRLLYDYIDYGNAFATVDFEASYREDALGNKVTNYVGPKVRRISPLDIVFNPIADTFQDSIKIIRSLRNVGELAMMGQDEPDNAYLQNALKNRQELCGHMNAYGIEEADKQEGFQMDGFGNYSSYLGSGYVEFLDFYGDIYNNETGELQRGRLITVVDRMWVIRNVPIPSWFGNAPVFHVGWRTRSDNLWAMGPLDNLVGMQYRIDHLENLKSDAMDLAVFPPLVVKGEVEEFEWGPGVEIHTDENGGITELGKNLNGVITADNMITALEQRMEMYAGAPREAMGIRTPGEKTAFEVQTLENAAGRIFQEKITTFEIELLERALNYMLETARRNLDGSDIIRVMDNDLGVQQFVTITKDDITANGILRPIGARHFAAQAQLLQNLQGVLGGPMAQLLAPHTSGLNLANLVSDVMGVTRYTLFKPNIAIFEQMDTQRLQKQAQENLQVEDAVPPAASIAPATPTAGQPNPLQANTIQGRAQTLQTRQDARTALK